LCISRDIAVLVAQSSINAQSYRRTQLPKMAFIIYEMERKQNQPDKSGVNYNWYAICQYANGFS